MTRMSLRSCEPIAWHPRSECFAATSADGLVIVDRRGQPLRALACGGPIRELAWSTGGDALFVGSEAGLRMLDASEGTERWRSSQIGALLASPDGRQLAVLDDDCVVLDPTTGAERWRCARRSDERRWIDRTSTAVVALDAHVDAPHGAAWSPDGAWLAVRYARALLVLAADDGACRFEAPIGLHSHLVWSEHGESIVELEEQRLARVRLRAGGWGGVAFSRDGRCAAGEGSYPKLNVQRGDEWLELHRGLANLEALAWSDDGALAVASEDGVVRRLARGADTLETWGSVSSKPYALEWSPDGGCLLVRGADEAWIFT